MTHPLSNDLKYTWEAIKREIKALQYDNKTLRKDNERQAQEIRRLQDIIDAGGGRG